MEITQETDKLFENASLRKWDLQRLGGWGREPLLFMVSLMALSDFLNYGKINIREKFGHFKDI